MSAFSRWYRLGVEDADRRVATALAPVPADMADRHLGRSRVIMAIDSATLRLRDSWRASATGRALAIAHDRFSRWPAPVQHQTVAAILLIAVVTHIALVLLQGPRPGWFWLVIPAMTAAFAALIIAGSRSTKPTE